MTQLKIVIPVYAKDKWDRLEKRGHVEVHSDVDNLSEGYQDLKIQIDYLLAELNAQNRLAENAEALEKEITQQAFKLKNLLKDIQQATAHYESLQLFLEKLGIDPTMPRLTFDRKLLLQSASVSEVEVLPDHQY